MHGCGLCYGMDGLKAVPSPLLQEANRRLHQLRTQVQRQTNAPPCIKKGDEMSALGIADVPVASIPEHLGWGSDALTAVIRQQQSVCDDDSDWIDCLSKTAISTRLNAGVSTGLNADISTKLNSGVSTQSSANTPNQPAIENPVVKLYPHIGLGMLCQEQVASGRLWLMLHHLDVSGSGQLRIGSIRATLTPKTSTLRLCGKRQLRNLLRDGDGLFWTRDKERVWLHSAARVAHGLGVERLTGRPVSIPVSSLLEGIGSFRAHLYTAFHSGRTKQGSGRQSHQPMPIARETLTQLSGVGASSQRTYEAKTDVTIQTNYAIGEVAGDEKWESGAWEHGRSVFELKDYHGEQGKKGKIYLAWQLPNSYAGKLDQRPLGRQKRINRTLRDLVMKGMPGNGGQASDAHKPSKMYYPNGKLAATAHGRDLEQDLYWRQQRKAAAGKRQQQHVVWQQL